MAAKELPSLPANHLDERACQKRLRAWAFYKSHLHASHPEYESWNKKVSWIYLVPIALITLPLVVGVGQLVPANVTPLVFGLSWASALGTLVAVFAIKTSGKKRFRRLWNEQYDGHATPL